MELAPQFRAELVPALPVRGRGAGQAMQQTGFPDQGFGDGMSVRDGGQFRVEHAGKCEQVVTLVLQCDAQRTDALGILASRCTNSSTMKSNSICRMASVGPASVRTSWLSHCVSVRMS